MLQNHSSHRLWRQVIFVFCHSRIRRWPRNHKPFKYECKVIIKDEVRNDITELKKMRVVITDGGDNDITNHKNDDGVVIFILDYIWRHHHLCLLCSVASISVLSCDTTVVWISGCQYIVWVWGQLMVTYWRKNALPAFVPRGTRNAGLWCFLSCYPHEIVEENKFLMIWEPWRLWDITVRSGYSPCFTVWSHRIPSNK